MNAFSEINEVRDAKRDRKKRQAFYTPQALVEIMLDEADVYPSAKTLEPSAGDGRIVHSLREKGVERVDCCEIEKSLHDRIESMGGRLVASDFLKLRGEKYDRVVMNPPFAKNQSNEHVEHAYSLLADGGRIVAIAPCTIDWLIIDCKLHLPECTCCTARLMDGELFKEYGTKPKVVMVVIDRDADREVEGFRNWSTYNAAITIGSDGTIIERAKGLSADNLRSAFSRHLYEGGGSTYGIDWNEVYEYLHQDEERIPF